MRRSLLACALLAACGPSSGPEGQCKDSLIAGDLVITEVFADFKAADGGSGVDDGKEWFEVYNASDRAIDLEGLTITHSRPDGSKAKSHVMAALTLEPGQYVTLGNSAPDLLPPYVDYGYAAGLGDLFNSDGGKLALSCGSSEIDSATYEAVASGASRQLSSAIFPDYLANDDLANWCEAAGSEFEAGNFGTPGAANDCAATAVGQCNDAGVARDLINPAPGDLVITEVMPNPAAVGDGDGEWFEVVATRDVDLNGVGLDRAGDSSAPNVIESADCIHVTAGSHVVFAKNADMLTNGGLPAVAATFKFALVDGSADDPGDVQILLGTTVLDAVTWTSTRSGKSHALDPGRTDINGNDDESNFCDGTTPYGDGDLGTPGAENDACPISVGPGQCLDGGSARAIVGPKVGDLVITELMAAPLLNDNGGAEWFEITNVSGEPFDLNELGIDKAGDNRKPDAIIATDCKPLAPGAFAVFARSAVPANNGGLDAVAGTFGFGLANTSSNVQIVDPATCDAASPFTCTTIFDNVTYSGGGTASSPFGVKGVSAQLDPAQLDTTSNDDAANFCRATTGYGTDGNQGTPGAANVCP